MDAELRAAERRGAEKWEIDRLRRKAGLRVEPAPLPAEVEAATRPHFAVLLETMIKYRRPDPARVRYFEKEHYDKATAWAKTLKTSPPLPVGPHGPGARWVWRKAHTNTYWVYVNTGRIYDDALRDLLPAEGHPYRPGGLCEDRQR